MNILEDRVSTTLHQLLLVATTTLENNKNCFVAQWLLQNPYVQINDWTMCQQNDWATGEHRYWMEKK